MSNWQPDWEDGRSAQRLGLRLDERDNKQQSVLSQSEQQHWSGVRRLLLFAVWEQVTRNGICMKCYGGGRLV